MASAEQTCVRTGRASEHPELESRARLRSQLQRRRISHLRVQSLQASPGIRGPEGVGFNNLGFRDV